VVLRVIDSAQVTDPAQSAALAKLRAWLQGGARRVETAAGSKVYQDADAIRIFDAWWPRLVRATFASGLGDGLFQALVDTLPINESPSGGQTGPVPSLPTSAKASPRRSPSRPRPPTRATTIATPATSGVPTRSCSHRWAASSTT
jgi:hypothetical protein